MSGINTSDEMSPQDMYLVYNNEGKVREAISTTNLSQVEDPFIHIESSPLHDTDGIIYIGNDIPGQQINRIEHNQNNERSEKRAAKRNRKLQYQEHKRRR